MGMKLECTMIRSVHWLDVLTRNRDIGTEPQQDRSDHTAARIPASSTPLATILQDEPKWLSHIRQLRSTDILILLTPVVVPIHPGVTDVSDPFEPLGRSLSTRHAKIRHVPYTQRYLYVTRIGHLSFTNSD